MEHEFKAEAKINLGTEVEVKKEKEVTPLDRLELECKRAIESIGGVALWPSAIIGHHGDLPDEYEILGLRTYAYLWNSKPGARLFVEEIMRLISGVASTVRKLNIESVQHRPAPDKREEYGKDCRLIRFSWMDEWRFVLSMSIEIYEGTAEAGKGRAILGVWAGVVEEKL